MTLCQCKRPLDNLRRCWKCCNRLCDCGRWTGSAFISICLLCENATVSASEPLSKCRGCGSPIRWEVTKAGKRMPLDADPVSEGNVVVENGVARVLTKKEIQEGGIVGDRFVSHHATCPEVSQFRKKP